MSCALPSYPTVLHFLVFCLSMARVWSFPLLCNLACVIHPFRGNIHGDRRGIKLLVVCTCSGDQVFVPLKLVPTAESVGTLFIGESAFAELTFVCVSQYVG